MARFAGDLLANLGDQPTPQAVAGLAAWASGEGSTAAFNPFDTTEPEPGATAFNSNGGDPVRNYPDYRTGLLATVTTLQAPAYTAVLTALRQGTSAAAIDAAVAASPWGTHLFPDPTFRAVGNFPGAPGSVPTGPAVLVGTSTPPAQPVGATDPASGGTPVGALAVAQAYAGLATVTSGPAPPASPSTGAGAAAAVSYALGQLGKPYVLGAAGPSAFDCSGLVQAAYRAAGVGLPRTTYSQVGAGSPVPPGNPGAFQPGDLLFIMGADPLGGLPGHVGMVVAPGQVIDAPYTGATVRLTALSTWLGQLVAVRRIAGSPAG